MNFKEMNETEFNEYLKLVLSSNDYLEQIALLAQNENFNEVFDELNERNDLIRKEYLTNKSAVTTTYNDFEIFYSIFRDVVEFKKILDKPNNYSLEERSKTDYSISSNINRLLYDNSFIFKNKETITLSNTYKFSAYRLYSTIKNTLGEEKYKKAYETMDYNRVSLFNHHYFRYSFPDKDKVNELLKIFKDIKSYNGDELKPTKTCIDHCLNTYNKISLEKCYKMLENSYFNSVFNDDYIKVYNYVSYSELYEFDSLIRNIYGSKYYKKQIRKMKEALESKQTFEETIRDRRRNYNLYLIVKKLLSENVSNYEIIDKLDTKNINLDFISIHEFKYYAKKYFYLLKDIDKFAEKILELKNDLYDLGHSTKLLHKIILSDDENKETIIKIFIKFHYKSHITPSILRTRLYAMSKTEEEKEMMQYYVNEFKEYYTQQNIITREEEKALIIKEEKKAIPKYEELVKLYLEAFIKERFLKENNISEEKFKEMLKILAKYNSPVAQEYKEYIAYQRKLEKENEKEQKRLEKAREIAKLEEQLNELKKVLNIMMIAKNKFTLLDYYKYTKMPLIEALKVVNSNMSPTQKNMFSKFYRNYSNDIVLDNTNIEQVYTTNIKYIIDMDDKGNILNSYETTKYDKEQAIIMLKDNNIPITNATFLLMLKKYYDETILPSLINNNSKTKNI